MDDLSRLGQTAELDQATAGARSVALLLATYFNALLAEGLSRDEALECALQWQEIQFASSRGGHGD